MPPAVIHESALGALWHAVLGLFCRRRREATATEVRLAAENDALRAERAELERVIAVLQREKETLAGLVTMQEKHAEFLAHENELARRRVQSWTAILAAQEAALTTPLRGTGL